MEFLKSKISCLPRSWQQRLRCWHYSKKLSTARIEDEAELGAVDLLVKKGQVVMDIGANFGLFTRFLSEAVGGEGTVYSFEPTEDMFEVLEYNVKQLGYSNVHSSKVALSDANGVAEIHIPRRADGTLNHYESTLNRMEEDTELIANLVQLVTLDDFCAERGIEQVDFIKCDVEGHELAVLAGAERVLRDYRPTILLEVNEPLDDGAHGTKVRELVESHGYCVQTYSQGVLTPWEPGQVRVNYVLVPPMRSLSDGAAS